MVSSLLAGAAAGSLAGSALADSLGRKTALLLDAVPLLIGALISATASNLTSMVMGRVFCGVGIGLASALVPLYISEVCRLPCTAHEDGWCQWPNHAALKQPYMCSDAHPLQGSREASYCLDPVVVPAYSSGVCRRA